MRRATRRVLVGVAALFGFAAGFACAQQPPEAPPRTVDDVLAVLDQFKPEPGAAERARAAARVELPATDNRRELAVFYHRRARASAYIGDLRKEINDLKKALEYAQAGLFPEPEALGERLTILRELSFAESAGGSLVRALESNREVAEQLRLNWGNALWAQASMSSLYAQLGDMGSASQALAEADASLRQRRNGAGWTWIEHPATTVVEGAHAQVLRLRGNYGEAERRYRSALASAERAYAHDPTRRQFQHNAPPRSGVLSLWAFMELGVATNLRDQGRLAEAESYSRSALLKMLSTFGRYSPRTAGTINNLASILLEAGRSGDAVRLTVVAIDAYERSGAVPESFRFAEARATLGAALVIQSRWAEANAVFEARNRGLASVPDQYAKIGGDNVSWGYALLRLGETKRALTMLQRMYEVQRSRGLPADEYFTAQSRGFYAVALAAAGERDRALGEFRGAVPVLLEQARTSAAAEQGTVARQLYLTWILEAYIDLLLGPGEASAPGAPRAEEIAEAFRVADVARGGAVQRALAAGVSRATLGDPALADLARREQDALQRATALGDLLNRLLASPPDQQLPNVTAALRKDVEQLRAQRTELRRELERRFPAYAELIDPKPVTVEQVQTALRPGEALIAIYVGAQRTYVWAVARDRPTVFAVASLGNGEVARIVGQLRLALDVSNPALDDFPKFDVSLARELYAKLLEPGESGWRDAKTLFIVPHKALGQLPFAVLVSEPPTTLTAGTVPFEEYRGLPWLLRRAAIVQLPTAGTLATLRRAAPAATGRAEFAGFGDPIFSPVAASGAARTAETSSSVRLRNLAIARTESKQIAVPLADAAAMPVRAPPVANSSGLAQLARLPDTADEILDIARTLGADPARDVFLGPAASEKNVKSGQLANRKIIAFATHGLVPGDLNGLTQPALALSAPEVTGNAGEDGLLTMDEVLSLKLDADWVVLSACNTAAGDGAGSEAVSGLGKAFFYAGARSLLVSSWPVETVSARFLTARLFAQQQAEPTLSRAESLRRTMLELLDRGVRVDPASGRAVFSYAHPMFWAPFSLIGDSGP